MCKNGPSNDSSIAYKMYNSTWSSLEGLNSSTNVHANRNEWFMRWNRNKDYYYAFQYTFDGFINVTESGEYRFYLYIDYGGSILRINDQIVIDSYSCQNDFNNRIEGKITFENSGIYSMNIEGYITDKSDVFKYEGKFRYVFRYSLPSNYNIELPVEWLYVDNSYDALVGLEFENHFITVPIRSNIQIPFKFIKGIPTECSSFTSALPSPLHFDLESMIITGMLDKTIPTKTYTIVCHNPTSISNSYNLTINVVDKYSKGLIASYMKVIPSFDSKCILPYTPSNSSTVTETIRREIDINKPFDNNLSIWDGLSDDFMNDFAVNWDGYIDIKEKNKYIIRVKANGAIWVYLDNIRVLFSTGCTGGYILETSDSLLLEKRFYSIKIIYLKHEGISAFELMMRKEGETDYYNPFDNYFHVYNGVLEYTYLSATYYTEREIIQNEIVFIDNNNNGKTIKEITFTPSLPTGLSCDKISGKIYGTPSDDYAYLEERILYNINIIFEEEPDVTVSTSITITIKKNIKPQGIYLVDLSTGEEFNQSSYASLGEVYNFVIKTKIGTILNYEISEVSFPHYYNASKNQLTVLIDSYNKSFEITGYGTDGSVITSNIQLNVNNTCSEKGYRRYTIFVKSFEDKETQTYISGLNIRFNFTLVPKYFVAEFEIDKDYTPYLFTSQCIPGGYYVIEFYAFPDTDLNLHFYVDGSKFYYYSGTITDEKTILYINTDPTPPIFNYKNNNTLEFYYNEFSSYKPETESFLGDCRIEPNELPEGLSFNKLTGEIYGKSTKEFKMKEYKVNCTNPSGSGVVYVNITVYNYTTKEWCYMNSELYVTLFVKTTTDPQNMKFVLINSNDEIVKSFVGADLWIKNSNYTYSFCLKEDYYIGKREDTTEYFGWWSGYITFIANDFILRNITVDYYETSQNNTYYLKLTHSTSSLWDYSIVKYSDWTLPSYSSKEWKKSSLSELPKAIDDDSINVLYLRSELYFTNQNNFTAYHIKFSHLSGIILYINGDEYYRKFISAVTDKSDGKFDALTEINLLLPVTVLNENEKTVLAMELHRHESETATTKSFPQITLQSLELEGDTEEDCTILNKYRKPITDYSNQYDMSYNKVENAFDYTWATSWTQSWKNPIEDPPHTWAIMSLKDNTFVDFNQFSITAFEASKNAHPKKLILSVLEDNNHWKEINTFDNLTFPSKKPYKSYYNLTTTTSNNNRLINGFMVDIIEKYPGYSKYVEVRDFIFHLCPLKYCSEFETFPISSTGSSIIGLCNNQTQGIEYENRTFVCENGKVPSWREIDNYCYNDKPSVIVEFNNYEFKVGEVYNNVELVRFSGANLTYEIVNKKRELSDISIDSKTGRISFEPIKEMQNEIITIKATSYPSLISTEESISITINPTYYPILYNLTKKVTLESGEEYNDLKLFKVLGNDLTFKYKELPDGFSFDEISQSFSGISMNDISDIIYPISFKVNNVNGSIDFTFYMEIVIPDIPNLVVIEDKFLFYYGERYENIYSIKCIGKEVVYSTLTPLPNNLLINSTTGEIYGMVKVDPSEYNVKLKCENINKTYEHDIHIKIDISDYPIIISHDDNFTVIGGVVYNDQTFFEISGKNLIYTLSTELPEGLYFNPNTGGISGYVIKPLESKEYTLFVNGNKVTKDFKFKLIVIIKPEPVLVPTSIKYNFTFEVGVLMNDIKLFEVAGENLIYTVDPDLPNGIDIDNGKGTISGVAIADGNDINRNYTFTVRNSNGKETVIIFLNFIVIYCERDSDFPKSIAIEGGNLIQIECSGTKSGKLSRKCFLVGDDLKRSSWGEIIDGCSTSSGVIAGITIGVFCGVIFIVFVVLFCVLRSGMIRKRATSTVLTNNSANNGGADKSEHLVESEMKV